jgi:hypothetical protein
MMPRKRLQRLSEVSEEPEYCVDNETQALIPISESDPNDDIVMPLI